MANENITHLQFGGSYFDAVICLDAVLPGKTIFEQLAGLPLLAADGASLKLKSMGLKPDYIIGDLDTFENLASPEDFPDSEIIRSDDQETNDFEKALIFAYGKGFANILILGFHGGELEHTLNNWSVFRRYSKKLNLCIYDEGRYGIPTDKSLVINMKKGELISLIPQTRAILKTKGLKWELDNEALGIGTREGARNVALQDEIVIEMLAGELLIFIGSRLPFAPHFV